VWRWEGAVGPIVSYAPAYSGAGGGRFSATLGYYLRYGRLSISNTGAFVTRRNADDIFQGLGLDLKRDDRLRLNVALRIDNGRRSSDVHGLSGVDDIPRTLRARFSATYQLGNGWKLSSGLNADLLAHHGGNLLDLGVSHDRRWSETTTWSSSAVLTAGDGTYMRSWYGVSDTTAMNTGLPVYRPGAGLRDVTLGTSWRTELHDWIFFYGVAGGRLLGPAAQSPLTKSVWQWSVGGGIARRF
jgi:outer membrane scaffolding protein for murein synthesis (MipA/OmpV family)